MSLNEKPEPDKGIYRVWHTLKVGNRRFTCQSDMVILDGTPLVVLEWEGPEAAQHPGVKLRLDETLLRPHTLDKQHPDYGYFSYDGPELIDPRPVN